MYLAVESLTVVEKLTEKAWMLPFVNRVDSITNFQYTYADNDGEDLVVESLVEDAINLDVGAIKHVREIALTEPSLKDFIQASDGSATTVVATFNLPNKSPQEIAELVAVAKTTISELHNEYPNVEIKPIGLTMLS